MSNRHMSLKELDKEILRIGNVLSGMDPMDPNYGPILDVYETLNTIRSQQLNSKDLVSKDAILSAVVTVVGTVAILFTEEGRIISSKALQFLGRFKA